VELHVAVGVVHDERGHILIAKRPRHVHQGDLWEFPGGKLEAGETAEQALHRELQEELNIEVAETTPLIQIRHAYPDRRVLLDVWRVERFAGTVSGLQGQPIQWVEPDDLPAYEFPVANRPIVTAVRLPDQYAILEDDHGNLDKLIDRLHHLLNSGVTLIQLRAKQLDLHQYGLLAEYAIQCCRTKNVTLLLNAEPAWVSQIERVGIHLTSQRLMQLRQRPLESCRWVAASCHNLEELRQAERIGVDFAVLAPVLPTASHPQTVSMGWKTFTRWVEQVNIPTFALGGLDPAKVGLAKRHGAQGVAGIRGFFAGMHDHDACMGVDDCGAFLVGSAT
jgi:8-oxo-dGTP diphosphatase